MKQNYLIKTFMLLVALVGGVSFSWAEAGNVTDLPTTGSVTLNKADATTSGTINNTTETNGEYGGIKNGATLLFKLHNTTAQPYTVSFLAGTQKNNKSVKVQILSAADATTADYEETIAIYNSGDWVHWCQYAFTTNGNVTTGDNGDKWLKLTFISADDEYICNVKTIMITAGNKPNSSNLVQIPAANNAAYTFSLSETVTYTSQGSGTTPNQKTEGSTPYYDNYGSNGMVCYAMYNNTAQYYNISFNGATENATSSFTFIVLDATGNVEATSTFSISTTSWTTFNETTLKSFTTSSALTTGHKTFILKFQNVNVANLTFTPAEATTQYTVTTSSNPAIGGTVFGAGTYDSGSDVNITQKAKWGYQFSSWTVNETAAGSESSYTISSIAANTNIVGNFSIYDGIFQSIPTAAESYLDLTLANPDLAINGKPTASYLDNYRSNEQTQFALRSSSDQKFNVSFKASRNDASSTTVTFTFATKAAPENIVCTKVVTVEHSGSWTDFKNTYNFATEELAAGDWIMTLTFGNTGTTCNIKDIAVTGAVVVALNESTNYTPVEKYANVTLTRSITAGNWSTICLPFNMTADQVTEAFGADTKIAVFSSYNSSTKVLTTAEASTITANTPCFIKVASNITEAKTIEGVTIVEGTPEQVISGDFKMVGVYSSTNMNAGDFFVANNQLYKATASTKAIKPFRAYFTNVPTTSARIAWFDDSETTAVSEIIGQKAEVIGDYYDLQGRKVAHPTKGLYIVNGKKVIIK